MNSTHRLVLVRVGDERKEYLFPPHVLPEDDLVLIKHVTERYPEELSEGEWKEILPPMRERYWEYQRQLSFLEAIQAARRQSIEEEEKRKTKEEQEAKRKVKEEIARNRREHNEKGIKYRKAITLEYLQKHMCADVAKIVMSYIRFSSKRN